LVLIVLLSFASDTVYRRPRRRCPFCLNSYEKLKRHIEKVHKDSEEVKQAEKEDYKLFRNKGMLEENKKQCASTNPVFQSQRVSSGDCLFCIQCKGFYSKAFFYRHRAKCQEDQSDFPKPLTMSMLKYDPDIGRCEGFEAVLCGLQDDEVGKLCKSDPTIKLVGARLWEKDRTKPDKTMEVKKCVRASMRNLGRLYLEFKQQMPADEESSARDMFNRDHFSKLREAVRIMTDKENSTDDPDVVNIKYGLKSSLYYLLINSATIMKSSYLETKGEEKLAEEVEYFISVLKLNQNIMFGDAKYHINKSRQEHLRLPSRNPEEKDVEKLRDYAVEQIQDLSKEYQYFTQHEFVKLRNALCCRLTMFNGRRGGEPSRLKIANWTERAKWVTKEQVEQLSEMDRRLFKSMEITFQTGKGNKLVSCFFPRDCVAAMDMLCDPSIRQDAGVLASNHFIFANTEGSTEHVLGWDATKDMCKDAEIHNPVLTATNNRGRISTFFFALELPPEDRQYFYAHMGHGSEVNAGTYQKPQAILAMIKVGRHLEHFDEGKGTFTSFVTSYLSSVYIYIPCPVLSCS
jgi:hypothetical protein